MKMQSVGASFRADWEHGIEKVELLYSVSAGVVRSLRAYAEADVAETLATIADAGDLGPGRAADVLTAWHAWHPEYVRREIVRLLPELVERYPTVQARRANKSTQQRRDRWARDGAAIVGQLAQYTTWVTRDQALENSGLRPGRFDRLIIDLTSIDAVRVRPGYLLAVTYPEWVWEKLRTPFTYI